MSDTLVQNSTSEPKAGNFILKEFILFYFKKGHRAHCYCVASLAPNSIKSNIPEIWISVSVDGSPSDESSKKISISGHI